MDLVSAKHNRQVVENLVYDELLKIKAPIRKAIYEAAEKKLLQVKLPFPCEDVTLTKLVEVWLKEGGYQVDIYNTKQFSNDKVIFISWF